MIKHLKILHFKFFFSALEVKITFNREKLKKNVFFFHQYGISIWKLLLYITNLQTFVYFHNKASANQK